MNNLNKALEESFELRSEQLLLSAELSEEHKFSYRHNEKMKDLIYSHSSVSYRYFGTARRRARTVAVICLMVLACAMCIAAVRKPIKKFIVNVFKDHYEVSFNSDNNQGGWQYDISEHGEIENVYELTNLPQGYEKESVKSGTTYVCTYYRKGKSELFFGQYVDDIYRDVYFDADSNPEIVFDENKQEYLVSDVEEGICVLWNRGDYVLHLVGDIDEESAIELCKSAKINFY